MIQSFLNGAEQIWSGWEIRVLVLFSLLLQIVLIVFGNWRKYRSSAWVGVVVWAAYLLSDSVATFSLGIISTNSSSSANKCTQAASEAVMVFWAPFLLVHLGGPDTITAYSLADNELWLRHFFGLLGHVGIVFYLLVLSWIRGSFRSHPQPLTFIAIPVLVSGVLKYGEKTWVLWSSSSERFKKTTCPPRVSLPTEEEEDTGCTGKEICRRIEEYNSAMKNPFQINQLPTDVTPEAKLLMTADLLFKTLKPLYANHCFYISYITSDLQPLWHESPEDAFKAIAIELRFMYDLLFSKASTAHSLIGLILRSVSLVSCSAAFLGFCIVVDKHNFSPEDIIVTYVLVAGAVCAEIYAIVMLIFSERMLLQLKKQQEGFGNLLCRFISACPLASMSRKRWLDSMAQYNLLDFCLDDKPAWCKGIQRFFGNYYKALEIGRFKTWEKGTNDLKRMIVTKIKARIESVRDHGDFFIDKHDPEKLRLIFSNRGEYALQRRHLDPLCPFVSDVEFDHSILVWHIATDCCYYHDHNSSQNSTANPSPSMKVSKLLSNYMLYLLVLRPSMLPKGNGGARYKDTCADVKNLISKITTDAMPSRAQVWRSIIDDDGTAFYELLKKQSADTSVSALTTGWLLAGILVKQLGQESEEELRLEAGEDKWDVIAEVWIEMLCYAANKCDWEHHIQELCRGGEFLTRVRLLMVHHGLSDQFRAIGDAARVFGSMAGLIDYC